MITLLRFAKITPSLLLFSIVTTFSFCVRAGELPPEERLKLTQMITETPATFINAFKLGTQRDQLGKWAAVIGLTVPLITYDEDIYLETQKIGRRWNISTDDKLKPYGQIGNYTVMWGPSDVSSSLYFLGDGWIHLGAAAGFLATGYFTDSTRHSIRPSNFSTAFCVRHWSARV